MSTRLAAFLIVILSPLAAFAQPLSDRVPAEALIYIGWQGSESMPAAYQNSHAKALLDSSNIPKVFNEMIPQLIGRLGRENPQAGEGVKILAGIGAPLWRHPTAIFTLPLDFAPAQAGQGPPMPRAAMICNAGNEADALAEQLGKLVALAQGAPFPILTFKDGTMVGITVGYQDPKAAMADPANSLSTKAEFKNALAKAQKEPIAIFYADTAATIAMIDQGIALFGQPEQKQDWPKIREALGLTGLKRIIFTGGFEGADWGTQCFIEAPAPRTGLLTLLEGKPASDDLIKAIPATASFAAACNLDLAKFVNDVRETLGKLDPNAQQMFDKGLGGAGLFLQMNIQKDFFETMGSQWAVYMNPAATGNGPFGITMVNRLAKPQEANKALGKIELVADNMINGQLAQQNMRVGFENTKIGNLTVHYVAAPFLSPSWAIADGNLYAGLYPQMVAEAAGHVSSNGKSLLDNQSFTSLRQKLAGNKANGFVFIDLPQTAPNAYQLLLMIAQTTVGMGELTGVKGPPMVLPPLSKLRQHLSPAAQFFWTDDAGWHAKSSSPFPGAELLGSQVGLVMSAPLGAAMILPAVRHEVRVEARAAAGVNNLKQIGVALKRYENKHGKYPADLSPLLAEGFVRLEVFVSPHAGTQIPADVRNGKLDEQAAWVNSRSDYVYLGGELKPNTANAILAYERPDGRPGMHVLFADGRVEWIELESARQMIEKRAVR